MIKSSSTLSLDISDDLELGEASSSGPILTTGVETSMNTVELLLKQCSLNGESKYKLYLIFYSYLYTSFNSFLVFLCFLVTDEVIYM